MKTIRPRPKLLLTQDEQDIIDNYIDSYKKDYSGLTTTDIIQLEDAAIYHVWQYRLMNKGLDDKVTDARTHPKTMERNILQDLNMTRAQRLAKQPENSSAEQELFKTLMSLSDGGRQQLARKN